MTKTLICDSCDRLGPESDFLAGGAPEGTGDYICPECGDADVHVDETGNEVTPLRDALDHIARTCVASRTQSRRIRWIEARARGALTGDPRLHHEIDLPKSGGPETHEKLRIKLMQERHVRLELIAAAEKALIYSDVKLGAAGQALINAIANGKAMQVAATDCAGVPAEVTQQPPHPELLELLHRGLRTWEDAPAWIVQWHDRLTGVPAPAERPAVTEGCKA